MRLSLNLDMSLNNSEDSRRAVAQSLISNLYPAYASTKPPSSEPRKAILVMFSARDRVVAQSEKAQTAACKAIPASWLCGLCTHTNLHIA